LKNFIVSLPIARECKEEKWESQIGETSVLVSLVGVTKLLVQVLLEFTILVHYMQKEAVPHKKIPGTSNDERPCSYADGNSGRGDIKRSQSTSSKLYGTQKKDKKEFLFDMKEQQVHSLSFSYKWKLIYFLAAGFLQRLL
jgi:hypothetical protein